ncbi:MAG: DUF4352 domain-containing protein [Liquorilactobacillus satsumensis]|uniref:DUF4352 domain-containing protein n=1 Tax=Lactobacillaceae TaxID=33958 RepID=UPI0039EBD191
MKKIKGFLGSPKFLLSLVGILFILLAISISSIDTMSHSLDKAQTAKSKAQKKYSKLVNSANSSLLDDLTGSSDDSSSSDDDSSSTVDYVFGDPISFTEGSQIWVNYVKDVDISNLQDPISGEHAVEVNVTVENTKSSPLDFNAQDFDLYDSDSEMGDFDANSYSNNLPESIAAGKKATFSMYFGAKNAAPYSVTYGDGTWNSK